MTIEQEHCNGEQVKFFMRLLVAALDRIGMQQTCTKFSYLDNEEVIAGYDLPDRSSDL